MRAPHVLRVVAASTAAVALGIAVLAPSAEAKTKPKLDTPEQAQKAMLTAKQLKAVTGYPGTLTPDPTQTSCDPFGNTFSCQGWWIQDLDSSPSPFRLEIVPFTSAKYARNDLARTALQMASKGATVLSSSPNKVALYIDNAPESGLSDAVLLGAVYGRFEVYASCGLSADANDPGAMLACAQKVSDAQAKKLQAFS